MLPLHFQSFSISHRLKLKHDTLLPVTGHLYRDWAFSFPALQLIFKRRVVTIYGLIWRHTLTYLHHFGIINYVNPCNVSLN